MKPVNMHEAKTTLSALVRKVRSGAAREVVIAVDGVPAARLVPVEAPASRPLGMDRGLIRLRDDFDAGDARIEKLFEGN
ncbi:MAG TPA: type II toxin-antitoxin system prevent-host-death family antitoxin [Candidatus Acidoferrales bacterium]|nr:type II toxin-antitoxin system prevent-host-death family antitoxin [Candidatus Acidoferrales bacterium]